MARARKAAESLAESEQSEQEQRETARAEAGQANQDQEGAPAVEQTPQSDTTHFIAQPDVLNAPVAGESSESSDQRREGSSGE